MTGPEHYREAERLLANVENVKSAEVPDDQQHEAVLAMQVAIAKAHVHATLALAAATAYPAVKDYHGDEGTDARDWTGATS